MPGGSVPRAVGAPHDNWGLERYVKERPSAGVLFSPAALSVGLLPFCGPTSSLLIFTGREGRARGRRTHARSQPQVAL